MKMVKSLLLGSAAGLVAVAGAQAADLPVKAAPVQYVKICSLYGAGFYYIPGTDMCLKVGGWVRFEAAYFANGSSVNTLHGDVNNRTTSDLWWRTRGYITADAREQTPFGVARAYIAIGLSGNNNVAFDSNRAFIQWAGFTFGLSQSFYDFYSSAAVGYFGWAQNNEDTGDAGQMLAGYTLQWGNGWSSTLAAEAARSTQIINPFTVAVEPPFTLGAGTINGAGSFPISNWNGPGYAGWKIPDVVGNIRVDQAWGSAQVMAAGHPVQSNYFYDNDEASGNPSDKWGWVAGAGLKLNAPFFGQGDWFQAEANYTEGALRYLFTSTGGGNFWISNGGTGAYGILSDAVIGGAPAFGVHPAFGPDASLELTTGWSLNASYEHYWNSQWKTSLYGSYAEVRYNDVANSWVCVLEGSGNGAIVHGAAVATAGCNNDWNVWTIGSRTQWNITKSLYMGLDIAYGHLDGAQTWNGLIPTVVRPATTHETTDIGERNNWAARFRVHKDFYP